MAANCAVSRGAERRVSASRCAPGWTVEQLLTAQTLSQLTNALVVLSSTAEDGGDRGSNLGSFSKGMVLEGPEVSIRPLDVLISDEALRCIIDAAAGRPRFTKGPANVEEETLLQATSDPERMMNPQGYVIVAPNRWTPPPVDETIKKILLGRPFSLELYRSLALKTELLDGAINMGDGNAILGEQIAASVRVIRTEGADSSKCASDKNGKEQIAASVRVRRTEGADSSKCASLIRKIPLANNAVGRRISDMEDIQEELTEALKLSKFAILADEAIDSVKDAHLVAYVWYINSRSVQGDLLFCEPLPGIASAEGVFKILGCAVMVLLPCLEKAVAYKLSGKGRLPAPSGLAMKQFLLAVQATHNPQRRIQKLKACLNNHFLATDKDRQLVENYVKLLEWQLSMAGTDAELCKTLVGQSVLESLSHACRHHWGEPRGTAGSPLTLSSQQGVSARHFQWTVLNVRASLQAWDDIDGLFITKSWLGGQKVKSVVLMERIVEQLHRHKAPYEVLLKYLGLIDNLDKRMAVARRIKCHKAVIDVFVLQRDRQALTLYKASLLAQSEDYFYAENALRATSVIPGLSASGVNGIGPADVYSSDDVCCLDTGLVGRVGRGRKKGWREGLGNVSQGGT
uniref:Uncharacterized protein n=1 Tax=Timema shepardi TaxID=629360 RepID=A0A7R9B045_TIMSH|nr:unnamed protein product [Timema shepardi]